MTKKLLSILTACLLASAPLFGQATAKSAFVTAPPSILPVLDASTRLDMIDYYESGSQKPSHNHLDGETRIINLDSDEITFSQGQSLTTSIAVLPTGKKEILMVINTYRLPAADSQIKFYTTKWEPIETERLLRAPRLTDWTGKLSADERLDLENALPFMTMKATYSPNNRTLTLTPTIADLLEEEDLAKVAPHIAPQLTYRWTGSKFKQN